MLRQLSLINEKNILNSNYLFGRLSNHFAPIKLVQLNQAIKEDKRIFYSYIIKFNRRTFAHPGIKSNEIKNTLLRKAFPFNSVNTQNLQ